MATLFLYKFKLRFFDKLNDECNNIYFLFCGDNRQNGDFISKRKLESAHLHTLKIKGVFGRTSFVNNALHWTFGFLVFPLF